jgi:transposase
MILGTDGRCNDPALAATACPACGAVGDFRQHSPYRRNLEDLVGGRLVCGKVTIVRVRCASCGATHALIPPNVSPYRQRSVRLQGAIALARLSGSTVGSVCEAHGIGPRSLYRLMACLPALLVALASLTGRANAARAAAGACASMSLT